MKVHKLKTDPEPFAASLRGDKMYELRIDDRGIKQGDMVVLLETEFSSKQMKEDGLPLVYTGRSLARIVTEKRSGYGLMDGYVCLGLRLV